MLPFAPEALQRGDVLIPLFEFLIRFWMPYLFIRAMAGEARPAIPNLGFVFFAVIAFLFGLAEGVTVALAHAWLFTGAGGTDPQAMLRLIFIGQLIAAAVTLRLLPLYAGTATTRLRPVEPHWWRGMKGGSVGLLGAVIIVIGLATVTGRLIAVPRAAFDPAIIAALHLRQLIEAAAFLFVSALALAACNRAANLPPAAASD
ncbi:MAG: hypothetical protein V2J26_00230 [Pacificimonas sp.]|jgi:hypothetical protein|nr:hypothetical protein [Pacificimonas sp.]